MTVAIDLPEDIVRQLEKAWGNMPRRALEAVVVEGLSTITGAELVEEGISVFVGVIFLEQLQTITIKIAANNFFMLVSVLLFFEI